MFHIYQIIRSSEMHYFLSRKARLRPNISATQPMPYGFLDIASTPGVRAAQEANGSGEYWANFKGDRAFDRFTPAEAAFIAERDSLYMATVSESGWPYVQHRGGPPGFIRILDEKTLAIPDFRGNRQYISTGNLATDDRAALILMDYPHRRRLKLYAHVEAKDLAADPELAAEAGAARLQSEGRARAYHPSRRLRLELPAAHRSAIQRSRARARARADARAARSAGGGKQGVARGARGEPSAARQPGIATPNA